MTFHRPRRQIDPQSYPQTSLACLQARFNLRPAVGGLSSPSDRSRLVLPDVTIAKVELAWVRGGYQRRTTW
jgi:hypothetical protein